MVFHLDENQEKCGFFEVSTIFERRKIL